MAPATRQPLPQLGRAGRARSRRQERGLPVKEVRVQNIVFPLRAARLEAHQQLMFMDKARRPAPAHVDFNNVTKIEFEQDNPKCAGT
eukprot:1600079-Heterocapsa_arctica.AAC.2